MDAAASEVTPGKVNVRVTPGILLAITVLVILISLLGLFAYRLFVDASPPLVVGQPAPEFQLETLEGNQLSLSDLRGRGVVLNFWASWCGPCRDEAELLESAWQREQDLDITFLGIAYLDQLPAAKRFLEEFNITYLNGRDKGSVISKQYELLGVPETYFIDAEGILVYQHKGVLTDPVQFQQLLDLVRP